MSNETPTPDDQKNTPTNPASNSQPQYEDWRSMRRAAKDARRAERQQWRAERRAAWGGGYGWTGWTGGAILILLGVIFLFQNLGAFYFQNWWALFILIPAFGAFAAAFNFYNMAGGRLNWPARRSLIGGFVLVAITAVFLFNLYWGIFFPVLLIIFGAALLLNVLLPG